MQHIKAIMFDNLKCTLWEAVTHNTYKTFRYTLRGNSNSDSAIEISVEDASYSINPYSTGIKVIIDETANHERCLFSVSKIFPEQDIIELESLPNKVESAIHYAYESEDMLTKTRICLKHSNLSNEQLKNIFDNGVYILITQDTEPEY